MHFFFGPSSAHADRAKRGARGLALVALTCACLWAPGAATAQDPTAAAPDPYIGLVEKAESEFALGHYAEARNLYERAHALNPNADTFRGMGMAAFEQQAYVAATRYLRAALAESTDPLTEAQRKDAERVLSKSEGFIALYELELPPGEEAATVLVDSRPSVMVDGILLLDPGPHEVVVTQGDRHERRQVRAVAGEREVLRIQFDESASASAPSEADPLPVRHSASSEAWAAASPRETWALATGAAGVTALVGSLGFVLRARGLRDAANCDGGVCPNQGALDEAERAVRYGNTATALTVAGGVAVALSYVLWLFPSPQPRGGERAARAGVSANAGPGFAGLSVRGKF